MNKKYLYIFALIWLSLPIFSSQEIAIGEEKILPVRYPKSSIQFDYNIKRKFHGFADPKLNFDLKDHFSINLSFEAGLLKYLNAGGIFGVDIEGFDMGKPLGFRLSIFAKPYVAINERCSVFLRIGSGITTIKGSYQNLEEIDPNKITSIYNDAKFGDSFGANAFALAGFEYFPWSRFGIALLGGFHVDFLRANKISGSSDIKSFNYMIYKFPIGLMFHIIF